jgi:uncharacterized protein (TIGR00730 family)
MTTRRVSSSPNHTAAIRPASRRRITEDEKLINVRRHTHESFTQSDPWRVLRIMGEFVAGFDALADLGCAVTIFGSARVEEDDPIYAATVETARLLGESGFTIITGGGPGVMEAGNRGAAAAHARSVGLNIELPFEQHLNPYTDTALEFRYFFVRKMMFVKYACAFVIFPGGFGTLDELMEALVLIQTGKVRNFPVILYGSDYWSGLLEWMRGPMLSQGMIAAHDLELMALCDTPGEVRDIVVRSTRDENWWAGREEPSRAETERRLSSRR